MKTLFKALIISLIMIVMVSSASAYQVQVSNNPRDNMFLDRSMKAVERHVESNLGLRAEAHSRPFVSNDKTIATATNYRVSLFGIFPDVVNVGIGETIDVDFFVDIKNNNAKATACAIVADTSIMPWKYLAQWCGVQREHHILKLVVGKSYRFETTAQTRIDAVNINSSVVQVTWTLPDEAYYTNIGKTYATVCPVDDGNNGGGNDPNKVDPSNPGKGNK